MSVSVRKLVSKQVENRLLASLPPAVYNRLKPHLVDVTIGIKEVLHHVTHQVENVFFPRSGAMSTVVVLEGGTLSEIAMVGKEGMVGVPDALVANVSQHRVFCQIPGQLQRLPIAIFEEELRREGPFRRIIDLYTQALFCMIAQSSACNLHHPIEQRCARWLLMTHDRVEHDEFPITQEFLSAMLGVRRASVTLAASSLQSDGLLKYSRGKMKILNRAGLEKAACECYRVVRHQFSLLIP